MITTRLMLRIEFISKLAPNGVKRLLQLMCVAHVALSNTKLGNT